MKKLIKYIGGLTIIATIPIWIFGSLNIVVIWQLWLNVFFIGVLILAMTGKISLFKNK